MKYTDIELGYYVGKENGTKRTVMVFPVGPEGPGYYYLDECDWPSFMENEYRGLVPFKPCEKKRLKAEQFRQIVRGEVEYDVPWWKVDTSFVMTDEDVYAALLNCRDHQWSLNRFRKWFMTLVMYGDITGFEIAKIMEPPYDADDDQIVLSLYAWISEAFLNGRELSGEELDTMIDDFEIYLDNKGVPVEQKELPGFFIFSFLTGNKEDGDERLDAKGLYDYRTVLERSVQDQASGAIRTKADLLYTGSMGYRQDFAESRDLYEAYYSVTGDPEVMNALGYIYYYGRCTDGVPEYEKAFRCFSVGHAAGIHESTYKLGDMFAHGYGIVENDRIAFDLYRSVYDETHEDFVSEEPVSKFADAAIRMGNCYKEGIHVLQDPVRAMFYYLQAELALKDRMKACDLYGDQSVMNRLQESMDEVGTMFHADTKYVSENPDIITGILDDNRPVEVKFRRYKSGEYKLTLTYRPFEYELEAPRIPLSVAECMYCEHVDSVEIRTDKNAEVEILYETDETDKFVFNDFYYLREEGAWLFKMDTMPVAIIRASKFIFRKPKKEKELPVD